MDEKQLRRQVLVFAVGVEGGLIGVAWGLGWLLGQNPLERCTLDARDAGLGVVVSLPMLALFGVFLRWPFGSLGRIKEFLEEHLRPLFAPLSIVDLAVISLLAGIGEEMLFRGVLQACLSDWLGTWPGLVLGSVVFGLVHLITPTYALLAAGIGVYLGWAWLATGNLLVPIVAHGLYDFLALVVFLRWLPTRPPRALDSGGASADSERQTDQPTS